MADHDIFHGDDYGEEEVLAPGNPPIRRFQIGLVEAAVWVNENNGRTFYSTTFSRRFKSKTLDAWNSTQSFQAADLLNVGKLAERAETFIARKVEEDRKASYAAQKN